MTVRWTRRAVSHLESIYRYLAKDKPEARAPWLRTFSQLRKFWGSMPESAGVDENPERANW